MTASLKAEVLSLDEARRARHAILFLAATMSGGDGQSLSRLGCPIPQLRYFRHPDVDIGIIRGAGPPCREVAAWARRRQVSCMVGRLWDRRPFAELIVEIYLADGSGSDPFGDLHLWTADHDRWWLVGRLEDPLLFALTRDGPIPTLTRPYRDEDDFVQGKTNADKLLSALLWP
jgi:hypothetical protein